MIATAAIISHNYTIEFDMNWQSHFDFPRLKLNYESQIVKLYLASFKPQFPERVLRGNGIESKDSLVQKEPKI